MKIKSLIKSIYRISFRKTGFETPNYPHKYDVIKWGRGNINENEIPKIIWTYWHDSNLPLSIETALHTMSKCFDNYTINVLNYDSAIKICPDLKNLQHLTIPMQSDYLRLFLLKEYGGIWIDASILFTEKIEKIFDLNSGFDLYCIACSMHTSNRSRPIFESYFLASPVNSPFINDWFEEFNHYVNASDRENYYSSYLNDPDFRQELYEDNWTYLAVYVSAMVVMLRSDMYRVYSITGSSLPMFYFDCDFYQHFGIGDILLINKIPKSVPAIIKLISPHRNLIDSNVLHGLYRKNSLFVKLSPSGHFRRKNHIRRLLNNI